MLHNVDDAIFCAEAQELAGGSVVVYGERGDTADSGSHHEEGQEHARNRVARGVHQRRHSRSCRSRRSWQKRELEGSKITDMLNRLLLTSRAETTGSSGLEMPVLSQASSSLSLARALTFGDEAGADGHVLLQPPTGDCTGSTGRYSSGCGLRHRPSVRRTPSGRSWGLWSETATRRRRRRTMTRVLLREGERRNRPMA